MSAPAIRAMQAWLKACPLVSELREGGVLLRVAYLGTEPVEFSIEDSPGDPVVKRYFSGADKVKNFLLSSRMEYSPDAAQQAANSGFFDELADWIDEQNRAQNLPTLGEERKPQRVEVTSSGYLFNTEGSACQYQMQLALYYYQPYF